MMEISPDMLMSVNLLGRAITLTPRGHISIINKWSFSVHSLSTAAARSAVQLRMAHIGMGHGDVLALTALWCEMGARDDFAAFVKRFWHASSGLCNVSGIGDPSERFLLIPTGSTIPHRSSTDRPH